MRLSCRCLLFGAVALLLGATACAVARRAVELPVNADRKAEVADVNDLHLEVTALQVLYDLQATPAQAKALAELAKKTAQEPAPRREIKISDKYRKALTALHAALAEDKEAGIEKLFAAIDERDKEAPEFDDIEITDAARKHAPAVLRNFSARQVVAFTATLGGTFPDPGERLAEGLVRSRELTGKEWRNLRDAIADDVGWLVGGVDAPAEERVRGQALALLNKAAQLPVRAYAAQKADLEKAARDLVGPLGPTDVVRHYMERIVAELLSNPQLGVALAARQRKAK